MCENNDFCLVRSNVRKNVHCVILRHIQQYCEILRLTSDDILMGYTSILTGHDRGDKNKAHRPFLCAIGGGGGGGGG